MDKKDISLFDNFNFLKVKNIEHVTEEDVYYDINVDSEDSLFCANGIMSHNSDPSRAFLMKENTFAVQCLVMSHVLGHVNIFTENKYFRNSRQDIVEVMAQARNRFNEYERRYGIDEVEQIVDAGHAIQLHSSPFDTETEDEKRDRIYNQIKKV